MSSAFLSNAGLALLALLSCLTLLLIASANDFRRRSNCGRTPALILAQLPIGDRIGQRALNQNGTHQQTKNASLQTFYRSSKW
jgi:hypothetical protein